MTLWNSLAFHPKFVNLHIENINTHLSWNYMASANPSYPELRRQIASRSSLSPVYLLHGEEGYYIDELVKAFEELVPEEERDFNLYILYAPESGVETVMDICHRYPMMAERQVVIVKEAQAIRADQLNKLRGAAESYNCACHFVSRCPGKGERAACGREEERGYI